MKARRTVRAPRGVGRTGAAVAALLLSCVAAAPGQEPTHAPLVLSLPASTGAMALGGAFLLSEPGSDVLFYNPALLERGRGFSGAGQRWGSAATGFTVSGATAWLDGGVGIGLQTLTYGVPAPSPAIPGDPGELSGGGAVGVSELVATAGIAKEAFGLRWGVALKRVEMRVGEERDATAAGDVGAAWEGDKLTVGLTAQNLGSGLDFEGADVDLPRRLTLAGATRGVPVGPLDLFGTGSLTFDERDEWIPGAGLQVEWWPVVGRTFIGRVGVRRVPGGSAWPLTFGAGFSGDDLGLSWAYQGFDSDRGGSHRIGVHWR